jgi:uroporphyrinogen-III decarboxylase
VTGSERLTAAVTGAPSDRVPIFCNVLDQGAREVGASLRDYYSDGELVAEAQLRMREKYGHDNVWALFYVGKEAELLGCRSIRFADDGPPNVEHFVIERPSDIASLVVPDDLAAHPAFEEPLRCLRALRSAVGGRQPICAYISSTMTLPAMLMGMEKWLELLLLGPADERDALLEKCHRFFVREVEVYRGGGADVILYSNPFGSTDTVSRKLFLTRVMPWIERDVRAVGPAGLVYYCGMSRMGSVIADIIYRTGIGVFYLSPLDDVAAGRVTIAGRGVTCGVINDTRMIDWTPADVRAEVRRIVGAGGPDRFLFGTGVMPLAIPEENIQELVRAAAEYGRLPGADS